MGVALIHSDRHNETDSHFPQLSSKYSLPTVSYDVLPIISRLRSCEKWQRIEWLIRANDLGEDPRTILKIEVGLSSKTFILIKYMTLCPKICNRNVLQNFDKIHIKIFGRDPCCSQFIQFLLGELPLGDEKSDSASKGHRNRMSYVCNVT